MREVLETLNRGDDGICHDASGAAFYAIESHYITNRHNMRLAMRHARNHGAQLRITPSVGHGALVLSFAGEVRGAAGRHAGS